VPPDAVGHREPQTQNVNRGGAKLNRRPHRRQAATAREAGGPRPLCIVAAAPIMVPIDLAERRFRRNVERLHALGPRAVAELLTEIAARRMIRLEIERLVDRYAQLDPGLLAASSGDRWPG
jgi:hypothetical protein